MSESRKTRRELFTNPKQMKKSNSVDPYSVSMETLTNGCITESLKKRCDAELLSMKNCLKLKEIKDASIWLSPSRKKEISDVFNRRQNTTRVHSKDTMQ